MSSDNEKTDTAYLAPERGIGAGVILSSDGYIVTNAHVVTRRCARIRVRLQGSTRLASESAAPHGLLEARLVGLDRQSDLAVLKIEMTNLPALPLADSSQAQARPIRVGVREPAWV